MKLTWMLGGAFAAMALITACGNDWTPQTEQRICLAETIHDAPVEDTDTTTDVPPGDHEVKRRRGNEAELKSGAIVDVDVLERWAAPADGECPYEEPPEPSDRD